MQKIERYENTLNNENILNLTVRKPFWGQLIGLVIIGLFCLYFFYEKPEQEFDHTFHYIITGATVIGVIYMLYQALSANEYKINMQLFCLSKKSLLLGITIKTIEIKWDSVSNYKYELEYDSYSRITAVWLIAYNSVSNIKRRLIKFPDMESFNKFKRTFQEKFTSYSIGEWHA